MIILTQEGRMKIATTILLLALGIGLTANAQDCNNTFNYIITANNSSALTLVSSDPSNKGAPSSMASNTYNFSYCQVFGKAHFNLVYKDANNNQYKFDLNQYGCTASVTGNGINGVSQCQFTADSVDDIYTASITICNGQCGSKK